MVLRVVARFNVLSLDLRQMTNTQQQRRAMGWRHRNIPMPRRHVMRNLTVIAGTTVVIALVVPTALAAPSGAAPSAGQTVLAAASNQALNDARTLSGRGVADSSIANRFAGETAAPDGGAARAASGHGVADPSLTNRFASASVVD